MDHVAKPHHDTDSSDSQPPPRPSVLGVRRGVIAIIDSGSRLLLIRRAAGVVKGGCWCFPGGHVEAGETPRRAIRRELMEELGVEVEPTRRVGSVRLPSQGYVLAVWRVRLVDSELRPDAREVAEVRWVTPAEIRAIQPGLPSNARVLEMLGH